MAGRRSTGTRARREKLPSVRKVRKWERAALAEQDETVRSGPIETKRAPLRKRAVARIPKKYRATRAVVHIVVGSASGAARVGKAVGKGSKWTGRRIYRDVSRTLYGPDGKPSVAGRPFRRTTMHTCACGVTTSDLNAYTAHYVREHRGEKRQPGSRPTILRSTARRTAGKTIVRPAGWAPTGRHRKPVAGTKDRVARLVEKYRPHIVKIGEAQMAADTEARQIARAFEAFADQPKPKTLGDLRAHAAGFERALAEAADVMSVYGRMLRKAKDSGGAEIAPELVNPFIRELQDHLTQAGETATKFIAAFEFVYGLQIRAAGGTLAAPGIDLSKTG